MFGNASEAWEPARAQLAPLLALYMLISLLGVIGNISLMAALASGGAARLRTPQLLSACAADLLVCAASAPLAAARAARLHTTTCHVGYYVESFPVAASTLSLVAMAAERCGAVRRGRGASARSRPCLAVSAVWISALLLTASTLSLVAMAAERCGAVRRGRGASARSRPCLAVSAVWISALLLTASTLSLVAMAAERCGAVRRGRGASARSRPCLAVSAVWISALLLTASTLSLVAMAAERCGAVRGGAVRRGRGASARSRPCLAVSAVWISALLLSVAAVGSSCVWWGPLGAAHALLTYCCPALAVARCHWAVRVKLTALSLTARAAHGELPLPVPLMRRPTHVIIVAGAGPRERRDAVDGGDVRSRKLQPSLLGPQPLTSTLHARRRLGNVLIAIAAVFAACWCPHAAIVIGGAFGVQAPLLLQQYALLLGHAHSALNAAAYWLLNRHALAAACAAWRLPQLRVREERPSSTNEAALGAFHPRLARPAPEPRPPPSSFLY